MSQLPESFLPNYRTPCWHRPTQQQQHASPASHLNLPPGSAADRTPQAAAAAAAVALEGSAELLQAVKQLQQQQQQQEQELQCLPYFHILGSFQSGAFSLYSMLEQHPDVAKGHNPRPHFWAEHDKNLSSYMAELQGALPYMQQRPGSALLGDASESSFAFYMAAGLRGHRVWLRTLQPCQERCAGRLQEPQLGHCKEACWQNATHADRTVAAKLRLPRWQLDTPLLMKAAYSGRNPVGAAAVYGSATTGLSMSRYRQAAAAAAAAAVPKLVVLLRDPAQRLLSSFLEYGHYTSKYGDGPEGFLAFVKEQLAAFEGCVARHGSLEECVLLFESLDTANEKVFFHCDQVLRGMYWVFLQGWQRHFGPDQLLVLLSEDLFKSPKAVLRRVVRFLGLAGNVPDDRWAAMEAAGAASHRQSLTTQHKYYEAVPEARRLVDAFYAPHNIQLGQLLMGRAVSPWEDHGNP
uniref:Sulfotransferase n=1 Tax=Tetradesmus obliquus TaxID=3088 RepID=A0A383WH12_TETOB|eukprot:jgi/Sobl393_1/7642/SZX76787.1